MTYRDGDDAALRRRDELAHLLSRTSDDAQREALGAEIAEIDRQRMEAARVRLPLVARARVASPCSEAWDTMLGDGAVRNCSRCEKEVFDLSQMTLGAAEALIASRVGEQICIRLFRRADGTMMFADCEVGARGVIRRQVGAAGAALLIGGAALAWATAPPPEPPLRIPHSPLTAELRAAGEEFLHPPEPPDAIERSSLDFAAPSECQMGGCHPGTFADLIARGALGHQPEAPLRRAPR